MLSSYFSSQTFKLFIKIKFKSITIKNINQNNYLKFLLAGGFISLPQGSACRAILNMTFPRGNGPRKRALKTKPQSFITHLRSRIPSLLQCSVGRIDQPPYNLEGAYTGCESHEVGVIKGHFQVWVPYLCTL